VISFNWDMHGDMSQYDASRLRMEKQDG